MPLSFVLVDDSELGYGMYIAAAFQYLGKIQNELLEAIVYLINENNESWENIDYHKYGIQKLSSHQIIMYEGKDNLSRLTDTFAKFYDIYNIEYGQGALIKYNFEKIENELALRLLTNKKLIDYENLNKIQYKFELLSIQNKHSNLLGDIKNKISQNSLPRDEKLIMVKLIKKLKNQNLAYLHQIFTSLDIILCQMRYSSKLDDITLSEFASTINNGNISSFVRETEPICNVRLSNILSLYELIEDKMFKHIRVYISTDYATDLEVDIKLKIIKFLDLSESDTKYPTPGMIRNALQRLIIRYLVARIEPKFPINEYMNRNDFWDMNTTEDMIDNFYSDFPADIMLFNSLALLDQVNEYINKKKEKSSNMLDYMNEDMYERMRENLSKREYKLI
jgi:hypothetical protein